MAIYVVLGALLWVLEGNARARGFYVHAGWTADGACKGDVVAGVPVTGFRYRRKIRVLPARTPGNCRTPSVA